MQQKQFTIAQFISGEMIGIDDFNLVHLQLIT